MISTSQKARMNKKKKKNGVLWQEYGSSLKN